jgi:tetratricopeptide (TPR) repeat protein
LFSIKAELVFQLKNMETLQAAVHQGQQLSQQGRLSEAALKLNHVLEMEHTELNKSHMDALELLASIYERLLDFTSAIDCYEKFLKRITNPQDQKNDRALLVATRLAKAWLRVGKYDLAISHLHSVYTARRECTAPTFSPVSIEALHDLASAYQSVGLLDEAQSLYYEAYGKDTKATKIYDVDTGIENSMSINPAAGPVKLSPTEADETTSERLLASIRKTWGDDNLVTWEHMFNLAQEYKDQNQPKESEKLLRICLENIKRSSGDHWDALLGVSLLLVDALGAQDRFEEAEQVCERLKIEHSDRQWSMEDKGSFYFTFGHLDYLSGRLEKAEEKFREAIRAHEQCPGDHEEPILTCYAMLGQILLDKGFPDEAVRQWEWTLKRLENYLEPGHEVVMGIIEKILYVKISIQNQQDANNTQDLLRRFMAWANPDMDVTTSELDISFDY